MADEWPVDLSLTLAEALVLSDYLQQLQDEGKLDPHKPAFDPALHRVLVAVHGSLERQLPPADEATVTQAYAELREQHRTMWDE